MLHMVAPCIEGQGHEAKLVTMLRDAGEPIDWRKVERDEPDEPLVRASEMPPPPPDQPPWDYHRWLLSMSGWHGYRDEHGRPVLPQGPTYMPPPPEQQDGSPEIQSMPESPRFDDPAYGHETHFSIDDLLVGGDYFDDTAASPHRPYPERAHDREASGSGTQLDYGSQLVDSLFHTPPPLTATQTADPWSTALTRSAAAEPEHEITPARVAEEGQVQWHAWDRQFNRPNRGEAPHRYTPSDYV